MKTIVIAAFTVIATLAAASRPAMAQPVVSPPDARTRFSSDYASLVELAYPAYDPATLSNRLLVAGRNLAARPDNVRARTLHQVELLMGIPGNTTQPSGEIDTPTAYYRAFGAEGKAFAYLKNDAATGMDVSQFAAIETSLRALQSSFLGRLGLPTDELMKVTFHKVMVQSLLPTSVGNSDGTPPLVRRGMTLAQRGFAGFPIEGAFVRVSSPNDTLIQTFSMSWVKFAVHSGITDWTLADAALIKRNITSQMLATEVPGSEVSVFMGVVFQPARTPAGAWGYVPAMKVVVTPRERVLGTPNNDVQTDAGQILFSSVLRTPPPVPNTNQVDPSDVTPARVPASGAASRTGIALTLVAGAIYGIGRRRRRAKTD